MLAPRLDKTIPKVHMKQWDTKGTYIQYLEANSTCWASANTIKNSRTATKQTLWCKCFAKGLIVSLRPNNWVEWLVFPVVVPINWLFTSIFYYPAHFHQLLSQHSWHISVFFLMHSPSPKSVDWDLFQSPTMMSSFWFFSSWSFDSLWYTQHYVTSLASMSHSHTRLNQTRVTFVYIRC